MTFDAHRITEPAPPPRPSHHCHAHDCKVAVPPSMFACKPHWFALPRRIRDAIWREYRNGQEHTKTPSARYMAVQQFAIATLAFKPHDEEAARIAATYLVHAERWRRKAINDGAGDPLAGLVQEPRP